MKIKAIEDAVEDLYAERERELSHIFVDAVAFVH